MYVEEGVPTGDFLRAILTNNLAYAVFRADSKNYARLKEIVQFVYWELPAPCWGSRDKVDTWIKETQAKAKESK